MGLRFWRREAEPPSPEQIMGEMLRGWVVDRPAWISPSTKRDSVSGLPGKGRTAIEDRERDFVATVKNYNLSDDKLHSIWVNSRLPLDDWEHFKGWLRTAWQFQDREGFKDRYPLFSR